MRVVGIIPVRMAASRFPGKPLALIHGRPMGDGENGIPDCASKDTRYHRDRP